MSTARFIVGDTRDVVASLPDASVDLVMTSPPFLALRSYLPADHPDKGREIGSEPDPATFIDTLLALTADWRRVLAPHGSICIELGDTYSGSSSSGGDNARDALGLVGNLHGTGGLHRRGDAAGPRASDGWPFAKCMTLVPELYRIGLAYGRNPLTGAPSPAGRWRVRNVVRWVRPNPPVGALGDKFRPATSDLVIACTAVNRWFDLDAVRTEVSANSHGGGKWVKPQSPDDARIHDVHLLSNPAGAPPLDWWKISPQGSSQAHYAVFPDELCVKPIEAMCPRRVCRACGKPSRRETSGNLWPVRETDALINDGGSGTHGDRCSTSTTTGWTSCGCPDTDGIRLDGYHTGNGWRPGLVLDPFCGTGTTMLVATGHGRDAIGIDLDPRNVDLARERLGMFLDVDTLSPRGRRMSVTAEFPQLAHTAYEDET